MSKTLQQVRSASPWGAHRLARFGLCASLLLLATLCWGGDEGGLHATPVYETTNRVVFKPCGRWPDRMRGPVYALQMVDNRVYAAVMGSGLAIFEITSEGGLRQVGCWPLLGAVYTVAVQGHFAYVGLEDEVAVIDVTDPKAIKEVSRIKAVTCRGNPFVLGNLAVLPQKPHGVALVDITNPANPATVGELRAGMVVEGVVANGSLAVLMCRDFGLEIWSFREPSRPTFMGFFKTQRLPDRVSIAGDKAYLLNGRCQLQVLDISDPSAPELFGSLSAPDNSLTRWDSMCVVGDRVFLAGWFGVDVIEVSEPKAPRLIHTTPTQPSEVRAVASADGWLVAGGHKILRMFRLTRAEGPVQCENLAMSGSVNDIRIRDGYAFVADGACFQVLDVRNPATPRTVARGEVDGVAEGVRLLDKYAFVADSFCPDGPVVGRANRTLGLEVFDISSPTQPVKVNRSSLTDHNHFSRFALAGGWAYMLDRYLYPVDLTDLAAPRLVRTPEPRGRTEYRDVCAVSNLLYVAGSDGLEIRDIGTPSKPTLLGRHPLSSTNWVIPSGPICLDVAWPYAYVGDIEGELYIVDITVPAKPAVVGSCELPEFATSVQARGKHLFLADGLGIRAVDVSRPEHPVLAGEYALPGRTKRIAVEGDHVYVCDWRDLIILRLEYPASK